MSNKQNTIKSKGSSRLWNDDYYLLHPRMNEVLKPHVTLAENFVCIVCERKSSPYPTGQLKNILGHFEESKTHKKHMDSEGLGQLNKEIVQVMKHGLTGLTHKEGLMTQTSQSSAQNINSDSNRIHSEGQKELKMDIAKFIVSQRLPYSIISELLKLFRNLLCKYDSQSLLQCQLSRTTVSRIAKKCIGATLQESIFLDLKSSPFSISLDETSDKFGSCFLAICVKYISQENNIEPENKLLCILPMDEDKSSKALYNAIKVHVLKKDSVLEQNFMGLVSDQAATMVGTHKGVFKRLQKDYTHIIGINDLSHIYHLITKHSVKKYPSHALQIIREVNHHFSNSCQRRAKFRSIQLQMKYEKAYDVKKFTKVRWLSLAESLSRIMDLWEPLQIYFAKYGEEGELENFTLENEVYLRNLLSVLELLVHYNLECQKQKLLYDQMLLNIQESLIIFAKMVIPAEKMMLSFQDLNEIPFLSPKDVLQPYIISIEEFAKRWVEEHSDIEELLLKLDAPIQQKVMSDTMDLVLNVLCEIKKRLPLQNKILLQSQVVFLRYWNADDWRSLSKQFTNIIPEEDLRHFNQNLLRMEINFKKHTVEHERSGRSILETWQLLSNSYPYLAKLARGIIVLPSSTVPVERVFSHMQDFKTPKRNRLNLQNIESSLLIYQQNGSMEFEITEAMLKKYDTKWKDEEKNGEVESDTDIDDKEEEKKSEAKSNGIFSDRERRQPQACQFIRSDSQEEVQIDNIENSPLSQLASYQQLTSLMGQLLFSPPSKDYQNLLSQLNGRDFSRFPQDQKRANSLESQLSLMEVVSSGSQVVASHNLSQDSNRVHGQTEEALQEIVSEKIEEEALSKVDDQFHQSLFSDVVFESRDGSLKRKLQSKSSIGEKKVLRNI